MNKPQNYDQTEARTIGNYEKPAAGAYIMKIVNAYEQQSKTGRPMLVLCLDISEGQFSGHFKALWDFLKSKNNESKWPCTFRRCTDDNQTAYFKGDIKTIEESNTGYVFDFNERSLIGKKVGCMLGEKETATGSVILEPVFLCTVKKVKTETLTPPTRKQNNGNTQHQPVINGDGFGDSFIDDDLPF